MRLPYIDTTQPTSAATNAIIERISARRTPRPLQPLDLALLHAPPLADGWNQFLGAVRTQSTLAADVRELAICRVAVLNGAWYEWLHHAKLARAAGVAEALLVKVGRRELDLQLDVDMGIEERLLAVLRFTDASTVNVRVPDPVMLMLKKSFTHRQVVEITTTVAAYNCVSRFLVALDVGEKNTVADSKNGVFDLPADD